MISKVSKTIFILGLIFICTTFAWLLLGVVVDTRTNDQDKMLRESVGQLWGEVQVQEAPQLCDVYTYGGEVGEASISAEQYSDNAAKANQYRESYPINKSDINVSIDLDQRKKGLLWYSTYTVDFYGKYEIKNQSDKITNFNFMYYFPVREGVYDNFAFKIDGQEFENLDLQSGSISKLFEMQPGEKHEVEISYKTQGKDDWIYKFGKNVSQIKNFNLTINTDFKNIDFPSNSISPTQKEETADGWKLTWQYGKLISGIQIGVKMPQRLNPGPFVSRLSVFAPVSLFFFFFIMFIITSVKKINLHPMNYFFLAASFFAYHLLLAYLVDHINVHLAVAISSLVSIGLVISYMRIVVGPKFAYLEVGISQFVYLLLFSYAFFLEGFTGLAITILAIVTLFIIMQFTARVDWGKLFESSGVDGTMTGAQNP